MRDLPISYGNSCRARFWSNKMTTWEELCGKLGNTIRTTETVAEYGRMRKSDREAAKDRGGFVAGHLSGNRRRADTVACRSVLALDGDRLEKGFIDRFVSECPYEACLYTTHSHTPETPRGRFLIPLVRDVSPDEYVAIARFFAREWGIDQFDECSYRPSQLMYWPTTPADGEYIFRRVEGPWLDPDAYLGAHPEWRDCSLLPTSGRESTVREKAGKQQEDPLSKKGVVGAFCRTYTIGDVMERFLSDVYAPSAAEGRYDFIRGEGTAGVVVYDEKFAYSHHATDPAGGKLLNAFDLVRIHRFGDEKDSFGKMCDFAVRDDGVRVRLADERLADAEADFADGDGWKKRLTYQPRTGILENTVSNLNLILENDPDFRNFAYNELANRIQVTGPLPWERPEGNSFWRDADTAQLKSVIDARYLPFSTRNHDISFTKVADDRHFHPVRDYLDSLPEWDGEKRVEDIFIRWLDADDTQYVRTVTRKTFAAAVARIYAPGTKFDCVPVLDGEQGIGKSSIFRDLVTPEFYSDTLSLTDMDDKSGAEKLQGFWVVEIGELAGMKKADIEKVKAFLSTSDDKYRPSYGRTVESHPRQCIIVATVNGERGYLRDITGNRRFWIIRLHLRRQRRAWNFDEHFRSQFWAEAREIWKSGEKLYLEGEVLDEAERIQRSAMEADERCGMIGEYLETPLPDGWDGMDLHERRAYLDGNEFGTPTHAGERVRTEVSNAEIWCECFGRNLQELKPSDSYGIAAMMSQITGWERTAQSKRLPIYGKQRLYRREGAAE
ncbi:MAG: virulence-associated E family protein [Bullifex sp.]|nr:virulence-associated E family protein [Bullifex sp.]